MSGRVHAKRKALPLASMRMSSQKVMDIVSLSLDALRLVALSLKVVTHQSSRPSLHLLFVSSKHIRCVGSRRCP